jgi:hypothetical protein
MPRYAFTAPSQGRLEFARRLLLSCTVPNSRTCLTTDSARSMLIDRITFLISWISPGETLMLRTPNPKREVRY